MRYSALSLYEASNKKIIKKYLKNYNCSVEDEFIKRNNNTSYVSEDKLDIDFDEAMAKICVDLSMNRHVGKIQTVYTPMGQVFSQEGKDLMTLPNIIGTGGVIVNSKNPKNILEASLFSMDDPTLLKPKNPSYLLDKNYILSAMGLLAMINENMAVRMLKKYIVKI
jgi:uncharacterized protein (TIGR01319 family)